MSSNRPVAVLWVIFPFVVVGWRAVNGSIFTGSASDALALVVTFVVIEAAVLAAARHLVLDRLWARRAFATAAVILTSYCALLGLWMGSFWGPPVVLIAVVGMALGLYTILHMASVTLRR